MGRSTPHPSQRHAELDEIVTELGDAIQSRDAALAAYLAIPEYSIGEDRARDHLMHCSAAVVAAQQRFDRHERGLPAPPRWGRG